MNFVNFVNKCAVCLFFQESVYIFRKSCEQEIVRSLSRQMPYRGHRFSRYSESSESGEETNRTEMISPDNEQYENRSRLLRYHYKQEPLRMQRKQRSSVVEYKRQRRMQRSGETEYKRQHRIQRSGKSSEAEYKQPMLPPAAYLERELRCIVCWLLILSAEI